MADFSSYLNVQIDSIEAPKPLPEGHYFAITTNPGWETVESSQKKTPMLKVTFELQSAAEDVDPGLLPENGVAGKKLSTNFILNNESGPHFARQMMEEAMGLPVAGLSLGEGLQQIAGQPVKLYITQRQLDDGTLINDVKKILSAA